MNFDDLNYNNKRLGDKEFRIKFKTGDDILNAANQAIAGEMFITTGDNGALYFATQTSDGANHYIYKAGDLSAENKIRVKTRFITFGITSSGGDFNLRSRNTSEPYDVDWGDGTSDLNSTDDVLTHTYAAGSYTIKVKPSGVYYPFYSNQNADLIQITSIDIGDLVDLGTSLNEAFKAASNMTNFTASDATSTVTNFYLTWRSCSSLTSFPEINTSSGTSFRTTWASCSSLTSFPSLDFSSAEGDTAFNTAWYYCSSLADFPANMFDTTGTISGLAFANAFLGCALTAQSIENILVSLDTNGASNITLGIDGGTNAAYSTWSSAAQTALSNLQTKGWTVSYNT
jgi:hypothetical protein